MRILRGTLVAAVLAVLAVPAAAQQNWKIGSAAQTGSVLLRFVDDTVTQINANSGGKIKVERHFIGSEQEITQQVVRGRLELAGVSYTGASVLVPEAAVLNMPYLWVSDAERDFVTDNYALPVLKELYEAKGLVILGLGEVGWNDVVCKTACVSPADVKGMKVRVSPAASSRVFWQALGANGVQMPLSEAWPALQSGLVEGADLPFLYYITTPAVQSAPHYVMTRHLHHGSTFVANKAVWEKLSPELRTVVINARPEVAAMRKAVADEEKPKMEEYRAKGVTIHELTDAQRAEWRKLVEPHQEQMVKDIGGRAGDLWEAIKKGKQAFADRKS